MNPDEKMPLTQEQFDSIPRAGGPEPERVVSDAEAEIMKEYMDVYNALGKNHRRARRWMDKKYGKTQSLILGSYKQKK